MKSDKALSNAELELTQRIQLHFPRGTIPPESIHAWSSCSKELLASRLAESFRTTPSSMMRKPSVVICPNRGVRPDYNEDITKVLHRELERGGPVQYDLTRAGRWLHPGQQDDGQVQGIFLYEHLKSNNMLERCLGHTDGRVIQGLGHELFDELFGGITPYLWRSVVKFRDDPELCVPYLYNEEDQIVMSWRGLSQMFASDDVALLFPDNPA